MSQVTTDTFNPALQFLGLIQQAIADGISRHCVIADGTEVYLVPSEQLYYTQQADIEALFLLCVASNTEISVTLIPNWQPENNEDIQAGRVLLQRKNLSLLSHPLTELLWYTTLCSSQGRLLAGHDLHTPVHLNALPDFSRLYHRDSDPLLATFMRENSMNLNTIAQTTSVPLTQVIDFYNASTLLGLSSIEPNDVFKPENYLLGLLEKGNIDKQSRCCVLAGQAPLFLVPTEGKYYTEANSSDLLKLCATPLSAMNISVVDNNADKEEMVQVGRSRVRQKKQSVLPAVLGRPLAELHYQTALHASKGRLLLGYKANTQVKLKQWPDKSLLKDAMLNKEERYFFTLALFMTDKKASLEEIATATQVPLAKVIDFHNACAVIGLIEQ
ncbi:MAG: hypothetical protein WAX77_01965 [Methylococcaceae bacterium]